MKKLYVDSDRYAVRPINLIVEATHGAVREMVRNKFNQSGVGFGEFVFGVSDQAITKEDFASIEKKFVDSGCRFDWSAEISAKERPDLYKPMEGMGDDKEGFSFTHPDAVISAADGTGREQRGMGDNVVAYKENVRGTARYIRSSQTVLDYMSNGVPDGTIAIIDDSGGTLTAPILEYFTGVICAGGTVRSHMGILAREYGVPCLMNSKVDGVFEGDSVEIEVTVKAKNAIGSGHADEVVGRIWRLVDVSDN